MGVLAVFGVFLVLTQLPALAAKRIMTQHKQEISYLPGTGKQLFQHLKKKFKLKQLKLETTLIGDHFNPLTNTVHLTEDHLNGKSLTAIAVVTHELSHALQHAEGSKILLLRTRLAAIALMLNKLASFTVLAGLSVSFFFPRVLYLVGIIWLASFIFSVLIHLLTLPVELDASYKKALPILEKGEYLRPADLVKVRRILGACAWTYVAQALSSFIFLALMLFRRS